jgi:prephenate dehydrogenase
LNGKNKKIKIAVIGLGQMGGSLGLALKNRALKNTYYIIGIARKEETLKKALKAGAVDKGSLFLEDAKGCDIAVICAPVDTIAGIYKRLLEITDQKTIITDAGSVKFAIEKQISKSLLSAPRRAAASFVGSHPMAGREKNGIESADAAMFAGANVIMTGGVLDFCKAGKAVEKMWKDAGAKIIKMDSKKHDDLAALTSHLPHVLAFCLNKIYKKVKKKNKEIDFLTAGSFKSMTRVSVSSADMWGPIFNLNAANIDKYLDSFIKELLVFKKSLRDKNKIKREILKTQSGG